MLKGHCFKVDKDTVNFGISSILLDFHEKLFFKQSVCTSNTIMRQILYEHVTSCLIWIINTLIPQMP